MKPLSQTRAAVPSGWSAPASGEGVIDLSGDYSHFTVPRPVAAAVVHAAQTTDLGRDTASGGRHLRSDLVGKLETVNNRQIEDDWIVLTAGSSTALCHALATVADDGEEVLIPDPGWPGYRRLCQSWGIVPVPYPVSPDGRVDREELNCRITSRAKAIVVSVPGCVTGAVPPLDELKLWVDIAVEHGLYLISDESLDMLRFEPGPALGPGKFDPDGRVITVYSFAKTHAMAGLRLGYVVARPELATAICRTQEGLGAGPSTLALAAGLAALDMDPLVIDSMRDYYRQTRDSALAMLPPEHLPHAPDGGFHLLLDISRTNFPDGTAFAAACYEERRLVVAPGPQFGEVSNRMVRLTLAARERPFGEGMMRLSRFLEESAG